MNVSLLTTTDSTLVDKLRACGARVQTIDIQQLGALATASAKQPDAVVVDRRDRSAIPVELAALTRHHPTTGVLMVLPSLDPALMLEAMRSGVNECVADPLTHDDLQAALRRIAANRPAGRSGEVFAVIGAKGGVGATTVAVNIASILNKLRPNSTLLIDLHVTYGDAGVFLGAEPRFSVLDAFENMERLDVTFFRGLLTKTRSGLHLLASSERPARTPFDSSHVRALIELASTEFPFLVIDVPRSSSSVLDALDPATTITVVANQELATVRSAGRMASVLEERYGRDRINVVITRYDEGSEIGQKDVERVVGRQVSYVFPNNYQAAVAALTKGEPLVLENHTKLASAITGYARALARMPAERATETKSSGLFSLLGGGRRG